LYPIAWGLCEGGNVIAPDSEAVFYGILDFLAKPCFGALLIWGHRNIDPADLGMNIQAAGHHGQEKRQYQDGFAGSNGGSDYTTGGMRNTLRKKNRGEAPVVDGPVGSTAGTAAHV